MWMGPTGPSGRRNKQKRIGPFLKKQERANPFFRAGFERDSRKNRGEQGKNGELEVLQLPAGCRKSLWTFSTACSFPPAVPEGSFFDYLNTQNLFIR